MSKRNALASMDEVVTGEQQQELPLDKPAKARSKSKAKLSAVATKKKVATKKRVAKVAAEPTTKRATKKRVAKIVADPTKKRVRRQPRTRRNMIGVITYVTEEVKDSLREICAEEDVLQATIMHEAVDLLLLHYGKTPQPPRHRG